MSWFKKLERKKGMQRRFQKTHHFLAASLPPPARLLDLGIPNELSVHLEQKGYTVTNTTGEDLDIDTTALLSAKVDAVTAFEIFEHLVNPMGVLQAIPCERIFVSVPLTLWFAKAYRNPSDPWDRHFHEFEDWQLDWLLEKSGWKVVRRSKWTSPSYQPGLRTILRWFVNRYYLVEAVRMRATSPHRS